MMLMYGKLYLFLLLLCLLQSRWISAASTTAEMEIIGAGLGRTGTRSLHSALEILGYKSYHYVDIQHAEHWYNVTIGQSTIDSLLERIVDQEGYTAIMDNPAADIFEQIHEKYPNAKVILTIRDSPEHFAKSWKVLSSSIVEITDRDFSITFPSFFQWISYFWYLKRIRCYMGTTHLNLPQCHLLKEYSQYPEGWLEEQYIRHNQYVIDTIPSSQLLVFNVKEGWEPLCRFLNKPIPNVSFPHVQMNTSTQLLETKQIFLILIYGWIPLLIFVACMLLWACCLRQKHRPRHLKEE